MSTTLTLTQETIADRLQTLVFADRLHRAIEHNFQPAYVPDSITELPRRRHTTPTAATALAALVFPEFTQLKADVHYEIALSHARRVVRQRKELEIIRQQRRHGADGNTLASETQEEWLGQEADPVSLDGPVALPMPVQIGRDEDFKDVFQFLHRNLDPKEVLLPEKQDLRDELTSTLGLKPGFELKSNMPMVEFKRGVVYNDGRLDLCKMVVGPTHIEKLLDALEENTVVTQFLLGNNVISTTGARRIAKFIADHPERIETWYVAGNHIRPAGFQLLVDAMVNSPRITNVWLKRNPLTPDSVDNVVRLITQTPNLRTLDLENTELGNEGVAKIMTEITGREIPLRNLYLNANGVGEKAAIAIAGYLAHSACKLESLYLGSNPVGDAGALPIAEALKSNQTLLRLSMASTGLTSKGIAALSTALALHPRIMSLDLAASQTTRVHGQRYNHLADRAIPALTALMQNPSMRHLDLGRTSLSPEGLEAVKAAISTSNLCEFHGFRKPEIGEAMSCPLGTRRALEANVKRFYPDEKGYDAFSNGLNARFLYSPEDVRLIDSVYRTRDQRGNKEIQQVWDEGDPVWRLVDADV
ncbi:hypothetical protein B0H16DRAFT_1711869 [Mycena metata]|uniref:RNI-like protein n=1 Tax=Mycena metata TaxID=1033252 RepID=A0AAD7NWY1_9AGAR|nr:hypothetical protein B0H16DRAFT_1711869 [Mycena metata]